MTVTIFFLVRHGETEFNRQKRFMGWIDEPINEVGRKQVALLGKRLANEEIDFFASSPLRRTKETVEAILGHHPGGRLELYPELGEIRLGPWEGLTWKEVGERYPKEKELWETEPAKVHLPGLETVDMVRDRVGRKIDELLSTHRGERILIATHDMVVRLAIFHLLEIDNRHYRSFPVMNASLSIVRVRERLRELILFNDTSHLAPLGKNF
ncbi:MAG: histidine phosphatase family protein [Acidobacteria bacterium]|nr:histidine phosphatase family protein [Acidobacteriota bacterium]